MNMNQVLLKVFNLSCFVLPVAPTVHAQAVTGIITDYGGYWQSSTSSINPIKPDNSQNLLAFIFNGVQYSTGVNDVLLTSHGTSFFAGDFRALPVSGISGTLTSNTKIGLGAMYDGVLNGPASPPPANNIPAYLTDGPKGLDLGTGAANLPVGTLTFKVDNLLPSNVGDGKPDILVTQIADPSTTLDRYEFTDINGIRVGNYVDISFNAIAAVGNWTVDFYEASQNPMTLQLGFTQTDRPIRLWAADFSDFGIDASNYNSITYFKITLGGNSDVAFVAYNYTTISILPVKLSDFKAHVFDNEVNLTWQTSFENNASRFIVEHSLDGIHFTSLGSVTAKGNSNTTSNYSYQHSAPASGRHYYRLKQVDKDDKFSYSTIVHVLVTSNEFKILRQNPSRFLIMHPAASEAHLKVINRDGKIILDEKIKPGITQTQLYAGLLSKGIYFLIYESKKERLTGSLLIQ
jgi:hypothetical protein